MADHHAGYPAGIPVLNVVEPKYNERMGSRSFEKEINSKTIDAEVWAISF